MKLQRARSATVTPTEVTAKGQTLQLSEVGHFICQFVPSDRAVELADLSTELVRVFGVPSPDDPTGIQATTNAVHELLAHGVLEIPEEANRQPPVTWAVEGLSQLQRALESIVQNTVGTFSLDPSLRAVWLEAAARHRVLPMLHLFRDSLSLDDLTRAHLLAHARNNWSNVAQLEDQITTALDALAASGVRVLVFKGLALAKLAYGDASARGFGDIDLLVAPGEVGRAHLALREAGWAPHPAFPTPENQWAWRHMLNVIHEMPLYRPPSGIDLHWSLVPSRTTFPAFDDLWDNRVSVEIAGRRVDTLSPFDSLAHSASHSSKDEWRTIRALVDVHRLASRGDTWIGARRPLRRDQLITLGLATILFGSPPGAPPVVVQRAVHLARPYEEIARTNHGGAERRPGSWYPGKNLIRHLRISFRARASLTDVLRHLYGTVVPVNFATRMPSRPGWPLARAILWRAQDSWRRLRN